MIVSKVLAVPADVEDRYPDTIYLYRDSKGNLMIAVTGNEDDPETIARTLTQTEIESLIVDVSTSLSKFKLVKDIAARNALTYDRDTMVLVIDATDDPTVGSGGAGYLYVVDEDQYVKFFETEGVDLELLWANVEGRPASTPGDIDLAVTRSHTHANKALLDAFTLDEKNRLTHNGELVGKGTGGEPLHPFFFG